MIKIIIWKLLFEFANLLKVAGVGQKKHLWYFAYGANMDDAVLRNRKISPLEIVDYVKKDFAITFDHPGIYVGKGFATIYPTPGKKVYGRLIRISAIDAFRLDFYEGARVLGCYERCSDIAGAISGEPVFWYKSSVPRPKDRLLPSKVYTQKLYNGLKLIKDPPLDYLEFVKNHPTIEKGKIREDLRFVTPWKVFNFYDKFVLKILFEYLYSPTLTGKLL